MIDVNRYLTHIRMKLIQVFMSKVYKDKSTTLKYYFKKSNTDKLIVVFSSCTRKGAKARYNYIYTLKNKDINQLYILDDFGYDNRGAYYLGRNNDFYIEKSVTKLIQSVIKENNINNVTFAGSSKGGYAALLFGCKFENSNIIVGAPQYYLGKYLDDDPMRHTLEYIIGEITEEKLESLNKYLSNALSNSCDNIEVLLHCSINEETYDNHVKDLIKDMEKNNIKVIFNKGYYKEHSEVGREFSKILIEKV